MGFFVAGYESKGNNILGFWDFLQNAYGSRAYLLQDQKQNTPPPTLVFPLLPTLPLSCR